jgi:membrane protease YdiL (CAAX protease family)
VKDIKGVIWFYVLAYAISWGLWAPLVLFPQQSGQLRFLVIAGAFGPFLAAVIVSWLDGGWAGLGQWFKSAFRWRIHLGWYLLGGLGLPFLIALLHIGLGILLGGHVSLPDDPPWQWRLLSFPLSVAVNAVVSSAGGEEPGWRGFALPRLVKHVHPVAASVLMGALWGPWHLPLFFTAAWQGQESMLLLFTYTIALSIIANWLSLQAKQSAIPAMLLHAGTNGYGALFLMDTIAIGSLSLGSAALKTIVYWLIAIVLVAATRGRLGYAEEGTRVDTREGRRER